MRFAYLALTREGRRQSGQLEAADAVDLEQQLHSNHLELIRYRTVRLSLGRPEKIPRRELINFCFHLEQLSRAGVPLLEGLADLRDSLDHPAFRQIVNRLHRAIDGGETFSQALTAHPQIFTPIFINLVRAGESSGHLPEILGSLTDNLKWEDELAAQTKKLLLYPAFVGSIVLAVSIFLMIFMVPQLKQFIKNMGQSLPLQTRLLFFISDHLRLYGGLLFATILLTLVALKQAILRNPKWNAVFDTWKLKTPLLGPLREKIILARFAGVLSMLYAAGIPLLEALSSTRHTLGNQAIEQAIQAAEQRIHAGHNLSQAFALSHIFPPLILRMLRIGENTGQLDLALHNVAYFYHRDIREGVGKLQSLIEPLLTLCMGALLGWIMLAVIGPIYDVISRIQP